MAPWYDDVVLPALIGGARTTYGRAIKDAMEKAGFDDMPRRGAGLVGGITRNGSAMRDVGADLGMSKQATSQLVDTLMIRGYVERTIDPEDRRRMQLTLTERGSAAAAATRAAVEGVDALLASKVGEAEIASARKVLGTLITLAHHDE